MSDGRPDPDALLASIQSAERKPAASRTASARGRLKVFLGMCAGVGKTWSLLEAARAAGIEGRDVLVGLVETHQRAETEQLLLGLELLRTRQVEHRGVVLLEFDLDACLARRPELVIVDELPHTNAPGSRHQKRHQDVRELLAAGISVYTALNVQHIESLNDVVAKITGVIVRETVPDSFLEDADEIELVDLPPEELLKRLGEGKVYLPQQAQLAAQNFFKLGNLIALRELALRYVAERVDLQVQQYRRERAVSGTWPVRERLLVCVTGSPQSARLVRAARRLAARLSAEWLAVHVETPRRREQSPRQREQLNRVLRLAEELGAETSTISAAHVVDDLIAFARRRNVTKLVVGKTAEPRWKQRLFGSLSDELARASGEIDVYVISGERDEAPHITTKPPMRAPSGRPLGFAALSIAACTALAATLFSGLDRSNVVMLYLVTVVLIAMRWGRAAGILASFLSVAAFDFFFVPPFLTFAVADVQYLVTFAVMLAVALLISHLTARVREQADAARRREGRTSALYELTRHLADALDLTTLLAPVVRGVRDTFDSDVTILLAPTGGKLAEAAGEPWPPGDESEWAVAAWVFEHAQMAGHGTATLPAARMLHLPLAAARRTVGVLAVQPRAPERFQDPDEVHLLETFARQTALAVERVQLAEAAARSQLDVERERLRSSLLSCVSHDLRTPLAAIAGAASALQSGGEALDAATRGELLRAISDEAQRLNRLVNNLLDMTRLESGAIRPKKEWHPLEEIVGAALARVKEQLDSREVATRLPADLPLVPLDGVLIEQVLMNLLENAAKYSPPETSIEISAARWDDGVCIAVADRGPGLPPGCESRVFERFFRGPASPNTYGAGLGLAICEGMVAAHGGRIWAENRSDGGALFRFTLPVGQPPPPVPDVSEAPPAAIEPSTAEMSPAACPP